MTEHERIAFACIIGVAAIMLSGLWFIRSFGCWALTTFARVYREENQLTRQSNGDLRYSHRRTIDEARAIADESTLAAERSLASFIATQKIEHEFLEKINAQRSA